MSFAAVFDLFMSMTTLFAQAGQDAIGTAIVLLPKSFAYCLVRPALCGARKLQFRHRMVFRPGLFLGLLRRAANPALNLSARAALLSMTRWYDNLVHIAYLIVGAPRKDVHVIATNEAATPRKGVDDVQRDRQQAGFCWNPLCAS